MSARPALAGPRRALRGLALALLVLTPLLATGHGSAGPAGRLARIGPAPHFTLTAQDGTAFSMGALRGKVVALSFVLTRCDDVCPVATAKMLMIQRALGEQFGRDVVFASVTVDPEHDTPDVLARYARDIGADAAGWTFLTGPPETVRQVARSYGVYHRPGTGKAVDHNLLTSLVDRSGTLRVQYMGERFDPEELLHDLRDLAAEGSAR